MGTIDYLAPEVLNGMEYGYEADWWAVGVMLYEFMEGITPFNDPDPQVIFRRIIMHPADCSDLSFDDVEISPACVDAIKRFLDPNPKTRLGARGIEEIKRHPFFAGVNWRTLFYEDRSEIFVPHNESSTDTSYFNDRRGDRDTTTFVDGEPLFTQCRDTTPLLPEAEDGAENGKGDGDENEHAFGASDKGSGVLRTASPEFMHDAESCFPPMRNRVATEMAAISSSDDCADNCADNCAECSTLSELSELPDSPRGRDKVLDPLKLHRHSLSDLLHPPSAKTASPDAPSAMRSISGSSSNSSINLECTGSGRFAVSGTRLAQERCCTFATSTSAVHGTRGFQGFDFTNTKALADANMRVVEEFKKSTSGN